MKNWRKEVANLKKLVAELLAKIERPESENADLKAEIAVLKDK